MASDSDGGVIRGTFPSAGDAFNDDDATTIDIFPTGTGTADSGHFPTKSAGKRRGRPPGSRNRSGIDTTQNSADLPSPEVTSDLGNDVAFALEKSSGLISKIMGDHWKFDKGETRLLSRVGNSFLAQVPGVPTQFGLLANALALIGVGALLIAPRIYITTLLVKQQQAMAAQEAMQRAAQAGYNPNPSPMPQMPPQNGMNGTAPAGAPSVQDMVSNLLQ